MAATIHYVNDAAADIATIITAVIQPLRQGLMQLLTMRITGVK